MLFLYRLKWIHCWVEKERTAEWYIYNNIYVEIYLFKHRGCLCYILYGFIDMYGEGLERAWKIHVKNSNSGSLRGNRRDQGWGPERNIYFFNDFFFLRLIDWLIDWLLCWVFVSVWGLPLVAASGGHSSSRCAGLSLLWPLLLRSTGSRRAGSVIVAHGPSCSVACGILPDQGSNPSPLH